MSKARYDGHSEWYDETFHHKTLAGFLDAFAQAGLIIRAVREFAKSGHVVLPSDVAVVTEKP